MALGAGEGSLSEGNKGGGGGLSEGNKGGGGGLSKRNMGGRSGDLAGADGEKGGLLEEGKGCSRQVPLLPDLHGILIPGPSAPSSTIDGVAPLAPIKIDFSRKERVCARILGGDGTPGFSKNSSEKAPAGGLRTRVRLFKGFRILPLGFKNSSQEEVSSKIKALGGQEVSVGEYDNCTHVLLGNETHRSLIAENWIDLSYNGDDVSIPPETATSIGSRPTRMPVNLNRDSSVRRELFPVSAVGINEEKIRCLHHQLFQCMNDGSSLVTFAAYAQKMRRCFIVSDKCPGTNRDEDDFHRSTLLELKIICKEIYLLLKALKKAGYSLSGNFSANNFVVIERVTGKGILFGHLQKDSLQWTSSAAEISDEKAFKRMVIGLFPKNVLPPHDLVTWLALVGRKDKEWLLLNNWTLLDEQDARERFLFLCGKLQELSESVHTTGDYNRIVGRLNEKGYNKWQQKIDSAKGNNYLKNTLNRVNPNTNLHQDYIKHAGGLLLLLRNCRHHYAKAVVHKFLMIVADNFPNLLMDVQEEMYIEGFCA